MDKLNVVRTHQEVEESAVHTTSLLSLVNLSKELPNVGLELLHKDRLLDTNHAHNDARSDTTEIVCEGPDIDGVAILIVIDQGFVSNIVTFDGGRKEQEVREAEIR